MNKELVILDTNVVLAGLRSKKGQSYKLLQRLVREDFKIALSVPLVLEYETVLRKHLDRNLFTDEDIDAVINYFCKVGVPTKIFYLWRPFLKDPYDDHILEVAFAAGECKYIITYNKKDFLAARKLGIEALTPREFLEKLGGQQ